MDDFVDDLRSQGIVVLSEIEFHSIVQNAAEAGAKRALESVGLHDDGAGNDVRDLRTLIADWRNVRSGFMKQVGRAVFWVFIAVAAFLGIKSGGIDGIGK